MSWPGLEEAKEAPALEPQQSDLSGKSKHCLQFIVLLECTLKYEREKPDNGHMGTLYYPRSSFVNLDFSN